MICTGRLETTLDFVRETILRWGAANYIDLVWDARNHEYVLKHGTPVAKAAWPIKRGSAPIPLKRRQKG